jgi:hypothetical protein
MHEAVVHHPLQWLQGLSAWARTGRSRENDLLHLAGEVEHEQPGLACELRGIAMHEAAAVGNQLPPRDTAWRRAGRALWRGLEAVGRSRAEQELRTLADRWEATQPELAKELRNCCKRDT